MINQYLFDLDDTLINTKIYAKLYKPILQLIESKTKLKGNKLTEKAKRLGLEQNQYGRWDTGELCKGLGLLEEYYFELERLIEAVPVLSEGVKKVFRKIQSRGGRIGIVSNSMHRTIETYMLKYDLIQYVDFIFSQEDAGCKKSNSDYWRTLIKREKLNPPECLVIGDNRTEDVEIPRKLGFNAYHLKSFAELTI